MASLDNITIATPKRQREEETLTDEETKRLKPSSSYNHILSLLEEEEEDPNQDLSSLITILQEELFSPNPNVENDQDAPATEEGERVMRRLLEASDDELGIPNREEEEEEAVVVVGGSGSSNSGGGFEEEEVFDLCGVGDDDLGFSVLPDGFWEFEDLGFSNGFVQPEMLI